MPITTSEILLDDLQGDGDRYLKYRWTFASGRHRTITARRPGGWDAAAELADKIPVIDAEEKDIELREIETAIIDGADYTTTVNAAAENTLLEVETFLIKRMANLLPDLGNAAIQSDVHQLVAFNTLFEKPNPELASMLGVSVGDANAFKSAFFGLFNGIQNYSHTVGPYPEVED